MGCNARNPWKKEETEAFAGAKHLAFGSEGTNRAFILVKWMCYY
jgi:hypothetical protein